MHRKALALMLVFVMVFMAGCNQGGSSEASSEASTVVSSEPASSGTEITIWHYFSGAQQDALNVAVTAFNETIGAEEGIVVMAENQGATADLEKKIQTASEGGIQNLPEIVHGYPDIMATLHAQGQIANLDDYLTAEQKAGYHESFVLEGSQFGDGSFRLMPIAKSTELLFINRTLWDSVKEEIGCSDEDLKTWDGIAKAGKAYYDTYNKSFFVIGSFANFVYLTGYQQGVEYVSIQDGVGTVNPDRDALERTFNFIKGGLDEGWLAVKDQNKRYPSDFLNSGDAVCYADSNSGTTYVFPKATDPEGEVEDELGFMSFPVWNDAAKIAVIQQGAGMAVTKKGEEIEAAAAKFLAFFTNKENTAAFSMATAYLPVQKGAENEPAYVTFMDGKDENGEELELAQLKVSRAVKQALDQFATYTMYYTPAFDGSNLIRRAVDDEVTKIFSGVHADFDSFYNSLSSAMNDAMGSR